jgi:hypothetical protein
MNKRIHKFRETDKLTAIQKNIKFTAHITNCIRKMAFGELKLLKQSDEMVEKEKNRRKVRSMVLNCAGTILKKPEKFTLKQARELLLKSLNATVHSKYKS